MNKRRWVALAVGVGIFASLSAAASAPAGGAPIQRVSTTVTVVDNTYDQSGHLLSSGTDERAEPARSQGGSYLGKSASGCRELTVKFTSTTVINTGTITYGQTKRWCWSANKVTGPNGSGAPVFTRYVCCNATNVKEVSWSPYSYFFQYDGLGPNSGHFSQVNGKFTICLGSLCADQYPYINIETHGNGTYSWYWYDGDYN